MTFPKNTHFPDLNYHGRFFVHLHFVNMVLYIEYLLWLNFLLADCSSEMYPYYDRYHLFTLTAV